MKLKIVWRDKATQEEFIDEIYIPQNNIATLYQNSTGVFIYTLDGRRYQSPEKLADLEAAIANSHEDVD